MVGSLYRITSLLVAVGILLVGHGLQLTLLPVYAQGLGWEPFAIGTTGSVYFLGFVVGCTVNPSIIARVGHIRAFMVMAAVATIALLSAGLILQWAAWLLFRFATGFALAGLYMVIESWLNEVSPADRRGTILAVYTAISLLGMAIGQSLMSVGTPLGLDLFGIGAVFLCLAIIPVGLTSIPSPSPIPSMRFTPQILARASRVAVVGAFFAGLVTGAFWTLGPVLGSAYGLEAGAIGTLMGLGILGGAVIQLPVGRLSDIVDRRVVIGLLCACGAGAALLGWLFAATSTAAFFAVMFLLGAATMPIYALCIAHASDNSSLSLVEVTSGTLIMHSGGSIIGPIVVAALMAGVGAASYFAYVFVCLTVAAVWVLTRRLRVTRPHHAGEVHTAMLPRTTQVVAEMSSDEGLGPAEPTAPSRDGA